MKDKNIQKYLSSRNNATPYSEAATTMIMSLPLKFPHTDLSVAEITDNITGRTPQWKVRYDAVDMPM
ncbi:hypothetical protein AGMMS50268_04150 [Spirochaetia bacterium]|nr:hypothetical protein AGMMS50268_04150 [Spirochaetia bacterium]